VKDTKYSGGIVRKDSSRKVLKSTDKDKENISNNTKKLKDLVKQDIKQELKLSRLAEGVLSPNLRH